MRGTIFGRGLVALCAVAAAAVLAAASPIPAPRVLVSYSAAFLENLTRDPGGRLVVTSYFDRTLLAGTVETGFAPLAVLPAHPVGIAATATGFVVTAHGAPFTSGPGFTSTNRILLLDATGKVLRDIAVPQAKFLNGVVAFRGGWLIADSIAATIWRFDPATGAVTAWLADARLAGDMAASGKPGANGLKFRGDLLYVSNSATGTIYTLAPTADGAPGAMRLFATPGRIDDFAFATDGTLYLATHADDLLAIGSDGSVRTVIATGCEACTAVAIDGDALVVLTTGNRASGGTLPAKIMRVAR